ncbi:MAG TPA: SMP-30/gluconolactonase/LRE family protein [Bryobacteraceae bacterium]|nr:SMP-30/gluconolactonase/LRE family protein [Bryobacteraceae bacterium]
MNLFITALVSLTIGLQAEEYTLGPDSQRQPGVPKGAVTQHTWNRSKIFPGTTRDYWIYVPAQYKADTPAAVTIVQDGGGFIREDGAWRAPVVFDNLIHKKQMPVTIGIFINPGVMPALSKDQQARFNRSFEYDALGDRYARFLIEEILPEVGRQFNLSKNPDHYAIAGSSSGGICAFTAAWNRPDAFRRVLSFIGSYTNLRGGHMYPSLLRKTEPRPLRVFLQDGKNDQDIYSGSWFIGNEDLYAALQYSGYDSTFVIGTEGHNSKHGSAILPEALRWLWRDYPKPVAKSRATKDKQYLATAIDPDQDWELVSEGYRFTEGPTVDKQGNIFFSDIPNSRIHRISTDGKVTVFKEDTGGANGLMVGPDGRLYACQNGRKRIVAYTMDGKETVIAEGVNSNDLAITGNGEIYFTDPPAKRVWLMNARGEKRVVHEGIEFPNGIALSPDQSLLMVADYRSRWVWSFQIQTDGSLLNGVPFHRLETPDDSGTSNPDGIKVDTEGHLYVATSMGIQVCDQPGRVVAILNKPQPGPLANLVFAGPDLQTLYVTAGDKIYRRRIRRKGITPWILVKPVTPKL